MVRQLLWNEAMVKTQRVWLVALVSMVGCSRWAEPTPSPAPPTAANPMTVEPLVEAPLLSQLRTKVEAEPTIDLEAEAEAEAVEIEAQAPIGTVVLERYSTVRGEPRLGAPELGLLAAGARVEILGRVEAEGCARPWLAIAPRGFVCARNKPTTKPATGMLPIVPAGARVPGVYGSVAKEALVYASLDEAALGLNGRSPGRSLTVRSQRLASRQGRSFWKTRHGWFAAQDVRRFRGSSFHGELLGEGLVQPMVWTLPAPKLHTVSVRQAPEADATVVAQLGPRKARVVLEQRDGFVRVDEGWILRSRVRMAEATEAPDGIESGERWIDIDLQEQVLVAYEGDTPIYATMISSGRGSHRTPTGVYRISRKVAERTMNSMADSSTSYSVDKVPWTAYFATGYALHAAFWHNGFGRRRSHGCVNLAPHDARALYQWMTPAAAPGWAEVYGNAGQPGAVVRLRSKRDPNPAWKGYAKDLRDAVGEPVQVASATAGVAPGRGASSVSRG
ncbi:MAG: L,D-transpeptidase [Deltaproteobacteria bacterium]|nr:L,D-transpeptidase [Deltaproteobacteria bacterium]